MASTLESAKESGQACDVMEKGSIAGERVGSDSYKQNHMGMIFQQGLSFSGFERNKVFIGTPSGRWADVSSVSGADTDGDCRAAIAADLDDDGDVDLFTNAVQREMHRLYRNDVHAKPRSVKVRLRATAGHPSAVGAIVKVKAGDRTTAQVLTCGGGFESQNPLELVFGLGDAESVEVTVRWPGRAVESFGALAPGRYRLTEGSGKAEARAARPIAFGDPAPRGVRVKVGDELTALDLLDLDGNPVRVELPTDRPALVNFWATTCSSCLAEMPELKRLHDSGRYALVAVSLDTPDRAAGVAKTAKRFGIDAKRIGDAEVDALFDLARLPIPVTLVVSNGKIERILQGRIREGDLD